MQTPAVIASILCLAVAASAAPAVQVRTGGSSSSCSTNTKQVCCNGLLNCVVQVISETCSGDVYCCNTGAPEVRRQLVVVFGIR
jgi:hypothetical protein